MSKKKINSGDQYINEVIGKPIKQKTDFSQKTYSELLEYCKLAGINVSRLNPQQVRAKLQNKRG